MFFASARTLNAAAFEGAAPRPGQAGAERTADASLRSGCDSHPGTPSPWPGIECCSVAAIGSTLSYFPFAGRGALVRTVTAPPMTTPRLTQNIGLTRFQVPDSLKEINVLMTGAKPKIRGMT